MLNDFRTKLLNLSDVGNTAEFIPTNFTTLALPDKLNDFYNLIYPPNSSRFYKMFLTYNFLNIIEATGMTKFTLEKDSRVSYNLFNDFNFFKFNRISHPIISDANYSINIYGIYNNNVALNNFYDSIVITQIGNSTSVDIYSKTNNKFYAKGTTLVFTDIVNNMGTSAPVELSPKLGVSFQITADINFTQTANKSWEFIIESPYIFDFTGFYTKLRDNVQIVDRMILMKNDDMFTRLWRNHYNSVYKTAGLLITYVDRI